MMERLCGNILESGLVVLAGATVFLHAPAGGTGGGRPWDGYFLLPAGWPLDPCRAHRLVLDDGRQGEIGLRTYHFNARADTPVLFKLAGAPPHRPWPRAPAESSQLAPRVEESTRGAS
jgi:hypothetical protein